MREACREFAEWARSRDLPTNKRVGLRRGWVAASREKTQTSESGIYSQTFSDTLVVFKDGTAKVLTNASGHPDLARFSPADIDDAKRRYEHR